MIRSGLVIDEPWIGKILAGEKTWEMRSRATAVRELIALIRKGSGQVVGVAQLFGCEGPLDRSLMFSTRDRHQIPTEMIASGAVDKWCYAWKLSNAKALKTPISYSHPKGAVIWVRLEERVRQDIQAHLDDSSLNSKLLQVERPEMRETKSDDLARRTVKIVPDHDESSLVPVAGDGTCFGRHLERGGVYTVGAKGEEVKYYSFDQALSALRRMKTARWRRPNAKGNWGIVTAKKWTRRRN